MRPQAVLFACFGVVVGFQGASAHAALPSPVADADFYDNGTPPQAKVQLGQFLFFDKILSGNRNISCATCHHPHTALGDALSLGIGEGGAGLGMMRSLGRGNNTVEVRIPRNAPPLFNLGAREFRRLFWDGRVEANGRFPSGVRTPANQAFPWELDNVLAAQAMFPVTSNDEMAGGRLENEIGKAAHSDDFHRVWALLEKRLQGVPEYVELFQRAFTSIGSPSDIRFYHAANALAAFQSVAFRSDNSDFDAYLRGEAGAMSAQAIEGMNLFYGSAGCGSCHQGVFQTDHQFYAIAVPQIGPGKKDGPSGREDYGRERETKRPEDRYRFRTPTLRNVALTGPWGHSGAYNNLRDMILHHTDPKAYLNRYDTAQARLTPRSDLSRNDFSTHNDPKVRDAIAHFNELRPSPLSSGDLNRIITFLHALTDRNCGDIRKWVPWRVPSNISITE